MKITQKIIIGLFCLLITPIFAQTTISGVTLPQIQSINDATLTLNGAGLREKLWIDLYVAGLYSESKMSDAKEIVNSKESMNIHIEIVSGLITRENFLEAVNEGFEKSTGGNTAKFSSEIAAFVSSFSDEIVKGDKIDISWNAEKGVIVIKNGKAFPSINGLEFKKALFGIWFGEKPADKKLMKGMLGE